MGGYGSGRRWDAKRTTEESQKIDIQWLKKEGCLRPGFSGSITWSFNGTHGSSVGIRAAGDHITLTYAHRNRDGEWEPVEQVIRFSYTTCHFGGFRKWFFCPRCNARVVAVYGAGKRFLCRHCYGLNYSSQHENMADRMMRKARKIRKRLGADNNLTIPIFFKPKNMHWRTFERLKAEADYANDLSWMIMGRKLGIAI